jgi:multidrug efflux pump subunit AcrA (membrane-fusion protein)
VSLLLLITGAVAGCDRQESAAAAKSTPPAMIVKTAVVLERDLARTVDLTGEVVAGTQVTISATVEGPISHCPWREGDRVAAAGDTLIVIDRPMYRAEAEAAKAALNVAEAKLADMKAGARPEEIAQSRESVRKLEEATSFAHIDLERVAALVAKQGLPGEALEKAKVALVDQQSQLESARQRVAMLEAGPTRTQIAVAEAAVHEASARLKMVQARLDECTLAAPFAGIINKVAVRPGDLATARLPLIEMYDPASLVVRFAVPESLAAELREGMPVALSFDALPGRSVRGDLVRVYPDLDRRMRTRTVEATVAEGVALVPGMFARIRLTLASAANVPAVPAEAVLLAPDGSSGVFVVHDGKAQHKAIQGGIAEGGWVQVLAGVTPGERVIVGGLGRLKDGMTVTVAPSPAQAGKPTSAPAEAKR